MRSSIQFLTIGLLALSTSACNRDFWVVDCSRHIVPTSNRIYSDSVVFGLETLPCNATDTCVGELKVTLRTQDGLSEVLHDEIPRILKNQYERMDFQGSMEAPANTLRSPKFPGKYDPKLTTFELTIRNKAKAGNNVEFQGKGHYDTTHLDKTIWSYNPEGPNECPIFFNYSVYYTVE